jgi:hypothetical protein
MANLFLTGSGAPTSGIGEVTDYYRDTVTNLIYYKDSPTNWVGVPSLIPTPDGVGTTWLYDSGEPSNAIGEPNDYYRNETNGVVYRKDGSNEWQPKGTLDFIGVYGVQWGNGLGAPTSTPTLNGLPAGSFYLDVDTSDIYFKDDSLAWVLKGQLGSGTGGGGGGSVTVIDNLTSTSTTAALSANQGKVLADALLSLNSSTDTRLDVIETAQAGHGDIVTHNASEFATPDQVATAQSNAEAYADSLVVGLLDDRGNYDPTGTSAYPTTGGSGPSGAILDGDLWMISVDGTIGGIAVTVGDTIRALVDSPAQVAANWAITQNNLIYVPENSANKSTDTTMNGAAGTYPDSPTVKTFVENSVAASLSATVNTQTGTSYTLGTVPTDNDGKTYLRMTNAAANTVTIPNTQTKPISISQRGAGTTTLVAGAGVTLNGDLTFTAQHQTKSILPLGGGVFDIVG